jgi:aspartyl-tRNA(Asn)/glutamyl-tRNA(Gln) amidotransferase subunit A
MKLARRKFLHLAAGVVASTTLAVSPASLHAQAPTPVRPRPARDRLEESLARIADPNGEGARACLTVYAEKARIAADASDARARAGLSLGSLDGAIVSIKDLFDVAGEPTRAGSKVLAGAQPTAADAAVVRRLRAAGCIIVAKTNMPEFALGSIAGLNPHYGTPGNPADRARVPGGSSSGPAVAVADGICEIGIGTDTGGSVRIPAALCGVVGFKPSRQRVPTEGAFPASFTFDSIGPLARSVAACADADAAMAGENAWQLEPAPLDGLRIGIAQGQPLMMLDQTVTARLFDALSQLGRAGVHLSPELPPLFDDLVQFNNSLLTIVRAEAYAIHRDLVTARGAELGPALRATFEGARNVSAADYVTAIRKRAALVPAMDARLADLDALVMPTCPIIAPTIADSANPETGPALGFLLFRNTAIANFFDLCAISLPLPRGDGLPVGLMLVARNGQDRRLLRIAATVERLFAG